MKAPRLSGCSTRPLTGSRGRDLDFYPEALRDGIDTWNERLYDRINNGVYKAGFATSQEAYEEALVALFDELDVLEAHLSQNRYLMGDVLSEADLRLWTTLVRFDPGLCRVHFKDQSAPLEGLSVGFGHICSRSISTRASPRPRISSI